MTDNEIIKALKECTKHCKCEACHFMDECYDLDVLHRKALDLINRQKAEIENLRDLNKRIQINANRIRGIYAETAKRIKAEAVKDLLIRLTMHFATYRAKDEIKIKDMFQIIQKFAEETVGDGE